MKKLYSPLLLGLLCLLLLQCQSRQLDLHTPAQNWEEHQQRMLLIEDWQIKGRIGITYPYQGGRKAVSARIDWQQQDDDFFMSLSGPVGMGRFTIDKKPNMTVLVNHQGEEFRARSPEQLFARHAGMRLPLSDLSWWVRGIPAPRKVHKSQFNPEGYTRQLARLEQSSWAIEYLDYQAVRGELLPQRIKLSDGDIYVTLIISEWLFNAHRVLETSRTSGHQ